MLALASYEMRDETFYLKNWGINYFFFLNGSKSGVSIGKNKLPALNWSYPQAILKLTRKLTPKLKLKSSVSFSTNAGRTELAGRFDQCFQVTFDSARTKQLEADLSMKSQAGFLLAFLHSDLEAQ